MRALLVCILIGFALGFAEHALRPRGVLGRAGPAARCAIPIERPGRGVACVDAVDGGPRAGDRAGGGRMAPERLAAWGAPVDINHATVEELASLDGIGPKLGARIVAARPFATVEDIARVRGVGRRRLARLKPRLFLDEGAVDRVR
jgi:competence ComEA-like helix-hairpin-helix protein